MLVWQKAIALAKEIYRATSDFPSEESFGLVSQMRRAAVSVPSNIAEVQARHTPREFVQFISNAEGSVLVLCGEFGYCSASAATELHDKLDELPRMLNSL